MTLIVTYRRAVVVAAVADRRDELTHTGQSDESDRGLEIGRGIAPVSAKEAEPETVIDLVIGGGAGHPEVAVALDTGQETHRGIGNGTGIEIATRAETETPGETEAAIGTVNDAGNAAQVGAARSSLNLASDYPSEAAQILFLKARKNPTIVGQAIIGARC